MHLNKLIVILARSGSRKLQALSPQERANIITVIANDLLTRKKEIMIANKKDLDKASTDGIKGPLYDRLALTENKLQALSTGLHQIAESSHGNVGKILRRTKVSDTLNLVQTTVPIGNYIDISYIGIIIVFVFSMLHLCQIIYRSFDGYIRISSRRLAPSC